MPGAGYVGIRVCCDVAWSCKVTSTASQLARFCNGPLLLEFRTYCFPEVDRIWGIWGSYYNIPKAIF